MNHERFPSWPGGVAPPRISPYGTFWLRRRGGWVCCHPEFKPNFIRHNVVMTVAVHYLRGIICNLSRFYLFRFWIDLLWWKVIGIINIEGNKVGPGIWWCNFLSRFQGAIRCSFFSQITLSWLPNLDRKHEEIVFAPNLITFSWKYQKIQQIIIRIEFEVVLSDTDKLTENVKVVQICHWYPPAGGEGSHTRLAGHFVPFYAFFFCLKYLMTCLFLPFQQNSGINQCVKSKKVQYSRNKNIGPSQSSIGHHQPTCIKCW